VVSGIGVVVNPRAGRNRRVDDRADRLGDVLGGQGWVRETRSLAHLDDVAAECRSRGIDVLGVCGGDGTLARTLTALARAYGSDALPRILPLRAGTMNTVARAMGCARWRPERMLAEIVDSYRSGGPLDETEHRLLRLNGDTLGFMIGAGVPVEFLRLYYGEPRRGLRGASAVLARLSASALRRGELAQRVFHPMAAALSCDGSRLPFAAYTVIYGSTIEDIGFGFKPTYRARERPGAFHVFAGCVGAAEFLRCMPRIWRGMPTGSARIHDGLAARLHVEFRDPTSYMVDGDIMEPTRHLSLELGPVVRVIRR
jgi:diacylglycerol kinase family enzyme